MNVSILRIPLVCPTMQGIQVPNMTLRRAWHHSTMADATTHGRPWHLIQPDEAGGSSSKEMLKRYRKLMLVIEV